MGDSAVGMAILANPSEEVHTNMTQLSASLKPDDILRTCGISSVHRVGTFPLASALLCPDVQSYPQYDSSDGLQSNPPPVADELTPQLQSHLHENFNQSQSETIRWAASHFSAKRMKGALASCPFTLVQGPPGTGKTHTVWGLLNVLHFVQYQVRQQSVVCCGKLTVRSCGSAHPSELDHVDSIAQRPINHRIPPQEHVNRKTSTATLYLQVCGSFVLNRRRPVYAATCEITTNAACCSLNLGFSSQTVRAQQHHVDQYTTFGNTFLLV